MAEKKKMNGGLIAIICAAVVAVIVAVVAIVIVKNNAGGNIVGKYVMTATIDSDGNESTTMVDFLKALGGKYEIEFKEDKTGTLAMDMDTSVLGKFTDSEGDVEGDDELDVTEESPTDQSTPLNFTYDDKKIKATSEGAEVEADYEYKDGVVILTMSGEKMKFVRE